MQLFDIIPQDLFSILASQNRHIYAEALMALYEAFQEQLKIPENTFFSMLRSRLENELSKTDFAEDGIAEEENENLAGRSRFLIRKLKERGWLDIERGDNFEKYIVVPEYSIRLLELFNWLVTDQTPSGFSYVFESYATLRSANEQGTTHFEKITALNGAYGKTISLIKTLKTVYHNINRYFQKQLDLSDINQVLFLHFDDFLQKIVEAHIRPLKIKDSVPKYKVPIMNILDTWLESPDILMGMASATLEEGLLPGSSIEVCRNEVIRKIFFIKESYEGFEQAYLSEIDAKINKYTRSTMQRIEYLTNNDRTVRGNLIFLLSFIANQPKDEALIERTQDTVQLKSQAYLSERSLYSQKLGKRRIMQDPVMVEDVQGDLTAQAQDEFADALDNPYTRKKVYQFMDDILAEKPIAYTKDLGLEDDEHYILSLMAVLEGENRSSPYMTEVLDDEVHSALYAAPNIRFNKKPKEG